MAVAIVTATLARREALLLRIAERVRGDFSGVIFDGRSVRDWIYAALSGDSSELDKLEQTLDEIDKEYR